MKPDPDALVTVMFRETAAATDEMPHRPGRVKFLGTPAISLGRPNPGGNPDWRVSAIRQGVMPTNGNGDVGNASTPRILTPLSRSCRETDCVEGLQSDGV